jgi:hypothetical protein
LQVVPQHIQLAFVFRVTDFSVTFAGGVIFTISSTSRSYPCVSRLAIFTLSGAGHSISPAVQPSGSVHFICVCTPATPGHNQ